MNLGYEEGSDEEVVQTGTGDVTRDAARTLRHVSSQGPQTPPQLTSVPLPPAPSQLGPFIDSEEPTSTSGFFARVRSGVAIALARISLRVAGLWLDVTGASAGDRFRVADAIVRSGRERYIQVTEALNLDPLAVAETVAFHSPLHSYRLLTACCPDEGTARERYLHLALERGESGALQEVSPQTIPDREQARRLWESAQSANPLGAVLEQSRFVGLPQSAILNALDHAIETEFEGMRTHLSRLPMMSLQQRERFGSKLAAQNLQGFLDAQSELNLPEDSITAIALESVERSPVEFLRHVESFLLSFGQRQAVIARLFQRDPVNTLETFDKVLRWSDGGLRIPGFVDREILNRFWLRILANRRTICFTDPKAVREMVFEKSRTHPERVIKHLVELGLQHEPFRDELAVSLAVSEPRHAKAIAESLAVDSPVVLERLAKEFAAAQPVQARNWLKKLRIEPAPETERALTLHLARVAPWRALGEALSAESCDVSHLMEIVTHCARNNAAQVCREIGSLPTLPAHVREQAFHECAKRNLWVTLEGSEQFDVPGTKSALKVFRLALARDPLRALRYANTLRLVDVDLIREAMLQAVAKNATHTVRLVKKQTLPEELTVELLQRALRRNPRLHSEILPMTKKLPIGSAIDLTATLFAGEIREARKALRGRLVSSTEDLRLLTACAVENYRRANTSAAAEDRAQFAEPEFLSQLAGAAISRGRWNSALEVARDLSRLAAPPEATVTTTEALNTLDCLVALQQARADLTPSERENAELFQRIRKAYCIPTDIIQRTLDHFGSDDYDFIFDVLQQGGSTMAETTCEVLLKAYGTQVDILPIDRSIISECVKLGFRGLSPALMGRLRPVFEASIIEGRAAVRNYQQLAERVLNGQPIDKELERSPLYPSIVTSAFRPVGLTERQVAEILRTDQDRSEHLKTFSYPVEGYSMSLAASQRMDFKAGVAPAEELYQEIQSIFAPTPTANAESSRPLTPGVLVKRMLQGAFDQLGSAAVWSLYRSESRDPRIQDAERRIQKLGAVAQSPAQRAEMLRDATEAFSVVSYDAVMEIAKRAISEETPAADRFRLEGKIEGQIRRILRLPPERIIGPKEFLLAIDQQADKLYRKERQAIQREAKKFTQHFGELKERYVMYLSKSAPAYFGRAGAGLCTARETWSWNSPTFLQMIMVDTVRSRIVGNIQLHLFEARKSTPAILARLNPTSSFLGEVDKQRLADEMLRVVREFAAANQLVPYIPQQTGWHPLTNRDGFVAPLRRHHKGDVESIDVRITAGSHVRSGYRV